MIIANLIMALVVMAGLWVVIVKALAASIRRTDRVQATAVPAAEAAPWRPLPANRLLA